jgi:hypothetical protein
VVFHDGFTMATTLEDVMPPVVATPAPEAPPAPEEQPAPIAETPSAPSDAPPGTGGLVPGDPALATTMPPASCGASATGGMPLLVLVGLTLLTLSYGRRKQALAPARRSPRR